MPRCPTCDGDVDLAAATSPPFCSDRCRLVDLGRWLDESHSLPLPPVVDDDEESEEGPRGDASSRMTED